MWGEACSWSCLTTTCLHECPPGVCNEAVQLAIAHTILLRHNPPQLALQHQNTLKVDAHLNRVSQHLSS